MTTWRILSNGQASLLSPNVNDAIKVIDAQAYRESKTGREENERLKAEFEAMVAAAPLRQVVEIKRGGWGFILTLECGHEAGYYKPRDTLRCHDCRKETQAREQQK